MTAISMKMVISSIKPLNDCMCFTTPFVSGDDERIIIIENLRATKTIVFLLVFIVYKLIDVI